MPIIAHEYSNKNPIQKTNNISTFYVFGSGRVRLGIYTSKSIDRGHEMLDCTLGVKKSVTDVPLIGMPDIGHRLFVDVHFVLYYPT